MCWSIFPSEHLGSPAGVGQVWRFHWPLGLRSYTGSTGPPVCSSALPLPAACPASHLLTRNPSVSIRPSTSPTLPCDSPLLPLLPTFQNVLTTLSAAISYSHRPCGFVTLFTALSFVVGYWEGADRDSWEALLPHLTKSSLEVHFHSKALEGNNF